MTPLTCSKTASTPQKQPPARTAVCSPLVFASGASIAGLGTLLPGVTADTEVVLHALIAEIMEIKIKSPEILSKYGCMSDIRDHDSKWIWRNAARRASRNQPQTLETNGQRTNPNTYFSHCRWKTRMSGLLKVRRNVW